MEHVKRTGEMDAVDTPERAGLNEEDSSDNEQDAQEWALARSFDEYIHKSQITTTLRFGVSPLSLASIHFSWN